MKTKKNLKNEYDIFISYRREGGESTAKIIRDSLSELGYKVFLDVESLRSGNFNTKLYSVIDECKDFLIILSPGALDRCVNDNDWVKNELERALDKEKNIIPIMLRGFEFPKVLPPSIDEVRYKNGIEANLQLYDAVISVLREFLTSKPRNIIKPIIIAAAALVCLSLILFAAHGLFSDNTYPKSSADENLTRDVIYYIEKNTTMLDLMADSANDAFSEFDRYINQKNAGSLNDLKKQVELSLDTIGDIEPESAKASAELQSRWSGSPFSSADLLAMNDALSSSKDSYLQSLAYLYNLANSNSDPTRTGMLIDDATFSRALSEYKTIFTNDLKAGAASTNQLLLPVTNESALDEFKYKYLPELKIIPLSATTWSSDYNALESEAESCFNNMNDAVNELCTLVGNAAMDVRMLKSIITSCYMEMGYTADEARSMAEGIAAGTE